MRFFAQQSGLLRDKWARGDRPSAKWHQLVSRFINNFTVHNGQFYFNGDKAVLTCFGAVENANASFAYTASGATITVAKSLLIYFGRGVWDIAEANVTVAGGTIGSPQKILVRCSKANPGDVAILPISQATGPSVSGTHWEWLLYDVYLTATGQAAVAFTWHRGVPLYLGGQLA